MINEKLLKNIYILISSNFDLSNIQLTTSDKFILPLLIYIKKETGVNIFFVRKNRLKKSTYSKIEGEINSNNILAIENILSDNLSLIYLQKSLEVLGKKISYVFCPIYNKKVICGFDVKFYKSYQKNIKRNYVYYHDNKHIFKPTKFKIEKEIFKKDNIVSFKNNIIINEGFGVIRSINSDNLTENWKTDLFDKNSYGFMPLITKDYIYIITKNGILFELLGETGIISRTGIVCDSVERNIIINVKGDQLIIAGLSYKNNLNSSLYFVKISDFSFIEIQLKGYISSELFYFNKKVYFGISGLGLSIYDNNSLFSYNIVGDIIGGFEVHKNNIYFSTTAGIVYIYNCINGLITNSKKISDYWIVSSPLVSNNKLYLTSVDKNLYILDLDLRINGLVKTNGRIISRPIKYKKYIIFGSNDSRLYFYNTEKLELSLSQFGERIVNSPIILNNNIFIQDFLNNIYSIDIKNYYLEKKQI